MNSHSKRDKWLEIALKKENLKSYKINYTGSTAVGDGFAADITFVNIQAITNDGEQKVYDFVIKDGDRYSNSKFFVASMKLAYERESLFYKTLLPRFKKFQQERNIQEPFKSVPKCFDVLEVDGIDILILRNAKVDGYEMHDITKPLNWKHLEMVFKEYARFHAISFAFKDQNPEEYGKLTENLTDIMKILMRDMNALNMFKNAYKVNVALLEERNELKLLEKYKIVTNEVDRLFMETDYKSVPYAVLTHSDCWSKNYLYKYKDDKQADPESFLILDWQTCKPGPPAWDLVYFFYCAAASEHFNRYTELLDIYYNQLSQRIIELGSDPNKVFPKSVIFDQWKTYARLGAIMAPIIYQLSMTKKEDLPDAQDVENFEELLKFDFKDDGTYFEKTVALLTHMINNDFL